MKEKKWNNGVLYLALTILFFSTFEVVSKTTGAYISATQLTFIRFFFGGLCLLPFAFVDLRRRNVKVAGKDILMMLLLGALNVTFSMTLLQYGVFFANASLSAVIFSANPIFVALFSSIILHEKVTWMKAVGLLLGLAGVTVAGFLGSGQIEGENVTLGVVLVILSAVLFGAYTVLSKKTGAKVCSLTLTGVSFTLGSLCLLPLLFWQQTPPFSFDWGAIWPQIIYLSVFVSGIAYASYFYGLSKTDTSLGSMTFFVKPILASIFAALALHETIGINLLFGMVLVLVGIVIVLFANRQAAEKEKKVQSKKE